MIRASNIPMVAPLFIFKLYLIIILVMAWLSTTSNWIKKQYFNSTHLIDWLYQGHAEGPISIFGMPFAQSEQEAASIVYRSVFWFTYQDELSFEGSSVISDVGWGCMLRVGQMMAAQAIRISAGEELYANQKFLNQLLREFTHPKGVLSLAALVVAGKKMIGKEPGEWYSPSDIALVLQDILNRWGSQKAKRPFGCFQMLVLNGEFPLKKSIERLRIEQGVSQIKPCLLVILVRIGYQSPEKDMLELIVDIVNKEPSFVGLLGGRPGKAHYIFGSSKDSFIYLDPHCVKHQTELEHFFCNKIFTMPHQKVDPSMGLCFFVRDLVELTRLHERLRERKNSPVYCYDHELLGVLEIEEVEEFQQLK